MADKTILVTGANAGIGFETAKALCQKGHTVVLVCRSENKAEMAVKAIISEYPKAKVDFAVADLSSQHQIRDLAENIKTRFERIDVLINNAGTWCSDFELTVDGIERQWAVNHLAPFLLTHLLLPDLKIANQPRVINVSSDSHFHGKIHFDDLNLSHNYHGLRAYAQSKLANVLFTFEFDRRNPDKNLTANAVQPGLVKTDIGLKHTNLLHGLVWKIRRWGGVTPDKGAATSVYLADSHEVYPASGKYWDVCKPKPASEIAYNKEVASRLWEISMEMCGVRQYF